jgi:hypothetical protein
MWQRNSIGPSTVPWGNPESTVVSFDFSPSTIVRIDLGVRKYAKKCYILSINKKSNKFYSLDNHILQEVQDNPYLGLQISNDLKWSR